MLRTQIVALLMSLVAFPACDSLTSGHEANLCSYQGGEWKEHEGCSSSGVCTSRGSPFAPPPTPPTSTEGDASKPQGPTEGEACTRGVTECAPALVCIFDKENCATRSVCCPKDKQAASNPRCLPCRSDAGDVDGVMDASADADVDVDGSDASDAVDAE